MIPSSPSTSASASSHARPSGVRREEQPAPGQPGRDGLGVPPPEAGDRQRQQGDPGDLGHPVAVQGAGTAPRRRDGSRCPSRASCGSAIAARHEQHCDEPGRARARARDAARGAVAMALSIRTSSHRKAEQAGRAVGSEYLRDDADLRPDPAVPRRGPSPRRAAADGARGLLGDRGRQRFHRRHRRGRPTPRGDGSSPSRRPGYGAAVHAGLARRDRRLRRVHGRRRVVRPGRPGADAGRRARGPCGPGGGPPPPGERAASGRGTRAPATP